MGPRTREETKGTPHPTPEPHPRPPRLVHIYLCIHLFSFHKHRPHGWQQQLDVRKKPAQTVSRGALHLIFLSFSSGEVFKDHCGANPDVSLPATMRSAWLVSWASGLRANAVPHYIWTCSACIRTLSAVAREEKSPAPSALEHWFISALQSVVCCFDFSHCVLLSAQPRN